MEEILEYVADEREDKSKPTRLIIVREFNFLSSFNLEYHRAINNYPIERMDTRGTIAFPSRTPSLAEAYKQVNEAEFLITTLGRDAEPILSTKYDAPITNDLIQGKLPFKEIKRFDLPENATAIIFRRI